MIINLIRRTTIFLKICSSFLRQFQSPENRVLGKIVLKYMNVRHKRKFEKVIGEIEWTEIGSVLDIACGGGQFIYQAAIAHPEVRFTGIDVSPASVMTARKLLESRQNCMIHEGTVFSLPFSHGEFDVITAFAAVYYWENLDNAFRELFRVQKNGGILFVECTQYSHNYDAINSALEDTIKGARFRDEKTVVAAMKKAGYQNIFAFKTQHPFFICITAAKPL